MDLHQQTISQLRASLKSGDIEPADILKDVAQAIESRDDRLNAYLNHDLESALKEAGKADLESPLGGIPIAIKDLINVAGQPCSCSSRILENHYTSPYDATAIRNLRKAGAIPFGRTNMDEFAMGSSTENSALKTTGNPWNPKHAPGGSSGGSAAVVAADTAIAALGSDTGGSIRQPASFCGCVGLKPSYGAVSRFGLVAYASSLDQIGPLTKTAEDAALVFNAISGPDTRDTTCVGRENPVDLEALKQPLKGKRIGLPKEYMIDGIDPDVRQAIDAAIGTYEAAGATVEEISLPHTEYAISVYYIIATAEASANLARFDGVRYGHRSNQGEDLLSHYRKTRSEGFGTEVKRRILLGTYVLSSGYYDAYYVRAQKIRTLIRQDFEAAFKTVDAILTPTAPTPAFELGEKSQDPLSMYLADIFTIAANLAGICGISIPCGFSQERHLPIGLQLLGAPFGEETLLHLAHQFEQATDWHKQKTPLFD